MFQKRGPLCSENTRRRRFRGPRRVTDIIVGEGTKELVDIEIDGHIITATDGHPFWVDDEDRWVNAEGLERGHVLLLADGRTVTVDDLSERTEVRRVHNLTVEGIHTFYVLAGADPVLVHNCGSIDDLSRAAGAADRNGLTAAGRAAQKHGNRATSSVPLSPDRAASGYNQFGQDLVDDLLTAPNTATRRYDHPTFGQVTEFLGPQYGARWGPTGDFLGLL
jgi:intein/homing endonuclease